MSSTFRIYNASYPNGIIRHEKASGTTTSIREILEMIGQGDELVV